MDPLLVVLVVILALWLLGFGFAIGGNLIHLLLVVVLVLAIIRLAQGRRMKR